MNNKRIRLTESDLHRIVKESVKRALNETDISRAENATFLYGNSAGYDDLHNDILDATEKAYIEYRSDERFKRWVPDERQRETLSSLIKQATLYAFRLFFTNTSSGAHILEKYKGL